MERRFEWDEAKARGNFVKHGVRFETAMRVFADPFAITEQDRLEGGEYRWRTMGMAAGVTLLVVAHTFRDDDGEETIRIISTRRAERSERRRYEQEIR